MSNSRIVGNYAAAEAGLASDYGSISVVNSTVSGNEATWSCCGGVTAYHGSVRVVNSTISGNLAVSSSAGVGAPKGLVQLVNSTITGNRVLGFICAVWAGDFYSYFSTIVDNVAAQGKGGAVSGFGRYTKGNIKLVGTIISGNTAPDLDDYAADPPKVVGDHNIVGTVTYVGGTPFVVVPPDTLQCDPNLAPLAANGGLTQTMALPAGSCALDAGPSATQTISTDQRGKPRAAGASTDIGAFERQCNNDPPQPDRLFLSEFEIDDCPSHASAGGQP